jgi:hypothetical protein
MKRSLRVALALMLGAIALPATSITPLPSEPDQVRNAAQGMYRWALAHPGAGLADKAARKDLEPFLSKELVDLLDRAETAEREYVKQAAADEKPQMLEGDLFVDAVEGAHEVALGTPEIDGDRARIVVTVIHIDQRYSKAHPFRTIVWQDTVELRRESMRWRVSDVLYRSDAARRLTDLLRDFAGSP